MTKEEIENLPDIEFVPILKASLLRLQNDDQYGNVIRVQHDGYDADSVIVAYIDDDFAEPIHIDRSRKELVLKEIGGISIDSIIK